MIFRWIYPFILLVMSCAMLAESVQSKESDYRKAFILGQRDLGDYQGIFESESEIGAYGRVQSVDEELSEVYISSLMMPRWFELYRFASEELTAGIFCPDKVMTEHFAHIQYYYRLIALSYLYETLKSFENDKICPVEMDTLLGSCKPKSSWMKQLIDLAQVAPALKISRLNIDIYKEERAKLLCEQAGDICPEAVFAKAARLRKSCAKDMKAFQEICSETDKIYGLSSENIPYWLLKRTHIVERFSSEEEALGCLKRFSQMMRPLEKPLFSLSSLFSPSFNALNENYKEGVLFAYGALQQYGELNELFKDSYTPVANNEKIVAKIDHNVFKKTKEQPVIIPKKIISAAPPKLVRKPQEKVHSAFYQACEYKEKFHLVEASVDMQKFHYDLLLQGEKKEKAHELLSKFKQREVLEMMKKNEKLGSATAPVPLVFLKYLLDTHDHQGLFNIIGVLGNDFYIRNDFDKDESKCRNEYSRFYYDRNQARWQLVIQEEVKVIKN